MAGRALADVTLHLQILFFAQRPFVTPFKSRYLAGIRTILRSVSSSRCSADPERNPAMLASHKLRPGAGVQRELKPHRLN